MTTELTTVSIDGAPPALVATPESIEEVASLLREANELDRAVAPLGGGTMLDLGAPPRRVDLALSTRKLSKVLDHQPANLTVSAQAGTPLGELNRLLAQHGQCLPLDPPCPDRATLGGILATNASGPLRTRYGTARDLLIGIRVVLADGRAVKGGGQVVKNVAGYDLPKLFIGSLGTLGVIVQATFKLVPLPKQTATFLASFPDRAGAARVLQQTSQSPLLPLSLELFNPPAARELGLGEYHVVAGRFGGLESAIARQIADMSKWSRDNGSPQSQRLDQDASLWDQVRDFAANNATVLKVGIAPARVAEYMQAVEEIVPRTNVTAPIIAHSVGILLIGLDGELQAVVNTIEALAQVAGSMRGHAIVQRGSRPLRERIDIWEPGGAASNSGSLGMMQKLKREFDPNGILNPGRFIGGI